MTGGASDHVGVLDCGGKRERHAAFARTEIVECSQNYARTSMMESLSKHRPRESGIAAAALPPQSKTRKDGEDIISSPGQI